jgi:hypothetical protein
MELLLQVEAAELQLHPQERERFLPFQPFLQAELPYLPYLPYLLLLRPEQLRPPLPKI